MKEVGLVGLPGSGKSTLFTALTRTGSAGGRAAQAVVPVPDPRVEELARLEGSRELVFARVQFTDIPGGTTAQGLAKLREADALCLVLRAFGPDQDPRGERSRVSDELLVSDLLLVEGAIEGARRGRKGRRAAEPTPEVDVLERTRAVLSEGRPAREIELTGEEGKHLRGLGLLSVKPWVTVANLEEGAGVPPGLPEGTVVLCAEIEAETAGMAPEEASVLLAEFGVTELGLGRVVAACYRALDLVTFFTYNEKEVHAWEIPHGATAPEAAGAIHTDLQRGFIRAEVVGFDDLMAVGGWDVAKTKGAMRVEGKDYVVREGDVIHVRFAV
jgi:ribosome-binding ATPase YchF (GTP1/OBG family)